MNQRQRERFRIAFGLNPHNPDADPLPRAAALKAWHAKWDAPSRPASGGWYKSVTGGPVQLATKSYTRQRRRIPVFSRETATNHRQNNAIVDLRADGETIYAGELPVLAIKAAGTDRYGFDLVELETDRARYVVAKNALHLKD